MILEENGTTTCIEGSPHDVIMGKPLSKVVEQGCFFSSVIDFRLHFEKVWWSWQDSDKGEKGLGNVDHLLIFNL